ncbi:MAG TPA: hypothetical protein VN151_12350 [Terracidiphilus sp.]|nr:hypothetical protein [Terracidiphilus sp.]
MMKKQSLAALILLLLIPVVTVAGGVLFSLINPEIAAGHPNYVRNWQLLHALKMMSMWGSMACVGVLWIMACVLVIRSKGRSLQWLSLAALGPIGFAVLASLNDRESTEPDSYTRFVRSLNRFVRIGYELFSFWILWELAWQVMVLKRNLMIQYQAATTGVSPAQIIDIQNASSGMWAFGEGLEVMYFAVLLYALRPIVYRTIARVLARRPRPASETA